MLKVVEKILKVNDKKRKTFDFFALSSREQKKIIDKVMDKANENQFELVERYEKKHGKLDFQDCSE